MDPTQRLLAFAVLVLNMFADDSAGHAQYLHEQAENAIRQAGFDPETEGRMRPANSALRCGRI